MIENLLILTIGGSVALAILLIGELLANIFKWK
jgi:hypothetical protein